MRKARDARMSGKLNPDHIALILHALSGAPPNHSYEYHNENSQSESLTAEAIKLRTPSLNNSKRSRLIVVLRFNGLIHEADGQFEKKYKTLAQSMPDGRVIWKWGLTEKGHQYLRIYDVFKGAHSQIVLPEEVPTELDWVIIPGSIRPAKGVRIKTKDEGSMPSIAIEGRNAKIRSES